MFQDRHLNFNKFLDQRAEEISKFRDILKLQTKKKGHQALPKSIRRRAMSHNRYRIPSTMRKLNQEQLIKSQNMQRVPKCRKHIRKRARLILSYKQRYSKIKWLSTHLWAARRMRMIDFHGYKVAQTPNQKSFRSSYRHFRHNCCMIDLSFYQCLTLRISEQNPDIINNIRINIRSDNATNQVLRISTIETHRAYEGYLYDQDQRLVCPLIIFNCGPNTHQNMIKSTIRCFFHPCALEQVKLLAQTFVQFQAQISKCNSQFYCLLGPEWSTKIHKSLTIYGIKSQVQTVNNLKFKNLHAEFFVSEDTKKQEKVPYLSNPLHSLMKQNYNTAQTSIDIRDKTVKLLELLSGKKNQQNSVSSTNKMSTFWDFYSHIGSHSDKVSFQITNRSKYTHKRKNKLTKQNKKKVISLQNKKRQLITSKNAISEEQAESCSHEMLEESLQNIKNEIKEFFIEDKQSKIQLDNGNCQKNRLYGVNPVLVTSFKRQQLYEGCYVLCSDQDSCRLWRILSKLNVKVIGLQQLNHISLESEYLSFPQNYIQTSSFRNYAQEKGQKQFRLIRRMPPQKRINFLKINSPNPFSIIQESMISNSHKIFVHMVNRGRCFTNSYIYSLDQSDVSLIEHELGVKGKIGIVLSETTKNNLSGGFSKKQKQFFNYSQQKMESLTTKLRSKSSKRKLVGRITTGGYLYNKSKQGGIGYVSKQIGQTFDSLNNAGYVLIRKVTSPHYYLAQITKIYPDLTQT